jgi:hypothetical protein
LSTVLSPSTRSAGGLDDLVDPLVAEVQGASEFAQRRATQMQSAYRAMKPSSGNLGSVFRFDEPLFCSFGQCPQLLVHAVYRM